MPYSNVEIAEYSKRKGKSMPTLRRWIKQGCNLRDPKSVREWVTRNTIRETNISKARKRRRDQEQKAAAEGAVSSQERPEPSGNGELPPAGKRGAQHALERLERVEEESHRRLEAALHRGNPLESQSAQDFWLRTAETLRRLDLAVEIARRQEETQVPLRLARDVALYISDWLRISFIIFLSSESRTLMGIKDTGQWKAHAITAFKSILHLTVRNSLKTCSPIPSWAVSKVTESWNIPTLDEDRNQAPSATASSGLPGPCSAT